MAYSYGSYSYGLCCYGLYSCGLCSYGLYSHGVHSYGGVLDLPSLAASHTYAIVMVHIVMACIVMACIVMACIVMACIVIVHLDMACPRPAVLGTSVAHKHELGTRAWDAVFFWRSMPTASARRR